MCGVALSNHKWGTYKYYFIGIKCCGKCHECKPLSEFYKDKDKPDGMSTKCKGCEKAKSKKWREDNPDYSKEYGKKWREDNSDYVKEHSKKWREDNPDRVRELGQKWREDNPDYLREWKKNRKQTDPLYASTEAFRCLTYDAYRRGGYKKGSKTEDLLGCSFEQAKAQMEACFQDGMSWDNKGEWHIDHIIPLSLASNEFELKTLCHYTNLQPLWAKDNISKNDKVDLSQLFTFLGNNLWAGQPEKETT